MSKPKLYKTASVREVQRNFAEYLEIAQIMPVYITHRGVEKGVIKTTQEDAKKEKKKDLMKLFGSMKRPKGMKLTVEEAIEKAKTLKAKEIATQK